MELSAEGLSCCKHEHDATAATPIEGGTNEKPAAGIRILFLNEPLDALKLKVVINPGLGSKSVAAIDGKRERPRDKPVRICRKLDPDADSFFMIKL